MIQEQKKELCSEDDLVSFVGLIHGRAKGLHPQIRYTGRFTVRVVMPHAYLSTPVINSDAVHEMNCTVNVDQHKLPLSPGCLCKPSIICSSAAQSSNQAHASLLLCSWTEEPTPCRLLYETVCT